MCHMPVLEQMAATAAGPAADAFRQLTREVTGKVRNSNSAVHHCTAGIVKCVSM
jgi:hypothetical protein